MTTFTIRSNELFGTIAETAVNTLNQSNLSYNVFPYDNDDPALTPNFVERVEVRISARADAISYTSDSDGVVGNPTLEIFTNPAAVARQTWLEQNLVGNQVRTIIHETIHASGNLDSRRDQISAELKSQGVVVNETLRFAIEELLTRQATLQVDVASDLFRAYHHLATIEDILKSDFYGKGIGAVLQPDDSYILTQLRPALTDVQATALLAYFNAETYMTPVVFVNGQFWENGKILTVVPGTGAIPEYDLAGPTLDPSQSSGLRLIDRFDNGGVALYINQNGQVVTVAENTRYTDNMLNNYGTEWVNSAGDLEGGWTFGATVRAFGDWLGLDGTFGLDGGFVRDNEGSAAAGQGAGGVGGNAGAGSSDRDDDDRSDRVVIITGGVRGGNKVVTDGGPKDRTALEDRRPILLDLDGDGIEITELDRSTVFMDASGSGLQHRTAWAGKGDGVLFYDADGSGTINDDREYVFTAWDKTAGDDLTALRSRFDTNGDGRLSGAELNNFKVMKTNADGSLTAVTLASLGITQINLSAISTSPLHLE